MATKSATKSTKHPTAQTPTDICDNCKHGTWYDVHWNRDLHGKPITLHCPFYQNGKYGIIRGTRACSHFVAR